MCRGRMMGTGMALLMLMAAGSVEAQRHSPRPAGYVSLSFVAAESVGELQGFIDDAYGAQIEGSFGVEPTGMLRMRLDGGFLIYGHERFRYCYSAPFGCRIEADLNTTNAIFFAGIGPELALPLGPIEPYANVSGGFSYFVTTSSLSDDYGYDDYGTTTNFDDIGLAWRAGAGVRLRVKGGRAPIALDFGVERHENGVTDFLTEGDIVDHPDGSVTLYPNRSDADFVTFRFGVSFGIPRGHKHR